ncbi:MAG: response regulator transcription factor [Robiginitomaculum sp.]|nr:response regulator transcription factor [Robiginitomaculum sp.]
MFIYACGLAVLALGLNWLEYKYFIKAVPTQAYVMLLGVGFTALGFWLGAILTAQTRTEKFELNTAAIKSLKITKRETIVLTLLGTGSSNKEIARSMGVSPNTVKTHMAHLFEKLQVSKRIHAVQKAKLLHLIP